MTGPPPRDWNTLIERAEMPKGHARLRHLANHLGVSAQSLEILRTCWFGRPHMEQLRMGGPGGLPRDGAYGFPMRDGTGRYCGIALRGWPEERKWCVSGSRLGAFVPSEFPPETPPVLALVEGPTDTAALLTAGVRAVGRPSNRGGVDAISSLLTLRASSRGRRRSAMRLVVVGEWDRKTPATWPGLDGAVATLAKLAVRLGTDDVRLVMPPDGVKDVREWLARDGGASEIREVFHGSQSVPHTAGRNGHARR
jgi:hypothetical protein